MPGAPAAMGSNGSAAGMGENGMKEEQDVLLVQRPRKTLYFVSLARCPSRWLSHVVDATVRLA